MATRFSILGVRISLAFSSTSGRAFAGLASARLLFGKFTHASQNDPQRRVEASKHLTRPV